MKNKPLLFLCLACVGCAGRRNHATEAVIAKAGQTSAVAENAFMAAQIPQTQVARDSIAGLGVAYNAVKDAQGAVLAAQIAFAESLQRQTDACSPFYLNADGKLFGDCKGATASVVSAKAALDAKTLALTARVDDLSRKTKALPRTKGKR